MRANDLNKTQAFCGNETSFCTSVLQESFDPIRFAKSLLPIIVDGNAAACAYDAEQDFVMSKSIANIYEEEWQQENAKETPYVVKLKPKLFSWSKILFRKAESIKSTDGDVNVLAEDNDNSVEEGIKTSSIIGNFIEEELNTFNCNFQYGKEKDPEDLTLIQSSGRQIFRFFLLDAYERLYGDPSAVYLFGRTYCPATKNYLSCCVTVCPLKRKLFVIPSLKFMSENHDEDIADKQYKIYNEFYWLILKPMGIKKFNCRFVWKRNFMDLDTKLPQMFMEIEYSAQDKQVNCNVKGTSFSDVYGCSKNCFEHFILEKKIKGPCWLDVSNPVHVKKDARKTWSHFEIVSDPDGICLTEASLSFEIPPLTILSFYASCAGDQTNNRNVNLMSWACTTNYNFSKDTSNSEIEKSYCAFVAPDAREDGYSAPLPEIFKRFKRTLVKKVESEKDLLAYFVDEFDKIDPDIVVGYDFQSEHFHKFMDRLAAIKIEGSSRLGRFKDGSQLRNLRLYLYSGRLTCDMKKMTKDFLSSKNASLQDLYKQFLQTPTLLADFVDLEDKHMKTSCDEDLLHLVVLATNKPINLLKLTFNTRVVPLAIKLTTISGNTLSQTFSAGILKRTEFLLLHALHNAGFVVQERLFESIDAKNKNTPLTGGLVLDPKTGFYDTYVLLMDFRSLYPSIIHEYNLCLTHSSHTGDGRGTATFGVLPSLMHNLIETRAKIKRTMNDLDEKSNAYLQYKIYASALKLYANGIYGSLASKYFRFHCPQLAERITKTGREILSNTVSILREEGLVIIYGDTDSIMVNTNTRDLTTAHRLAEHIKNTINKQYNSVELDLESIFKRLLLISKKQYAGVCVSIVENMEHKLDRILKGLDMIRSDWPIYVCQTGVKVVECILNDDSLTDKVNKIKQLLDRTKRELLNRKVPVKSLIITESLNHELENYAANASYPHVQVARRCIENSICSFKKGDSVPYVMCRVKKRNGAYYKGPYHLDELNSYEHWEVDTRYYLLKKVYPMVSRICGTYDELYPPLKEAIRAEHIGLDCDEAFIDYELDEQTEFHPRDPFAFECSQCGHMNSASAEQIDLTKCQNLDCNACPLLTWPYLTNQVIYAVRRYVGVYYASERQCDNRKCKNITRILPLNYCAAEKQICSECGEGELHLIYTGMDLFLQLEYFKHCFESGRSRSTQEWEQDAYKKLFEQVDVYSQQSAFRTVNLTELFGFIYG